MKYRCVQHYRCEKCGVDTEPTRIDVYDLPAPPIIFHKEMCDPCFDAMSEDERVAWWNECARRNKEQIAKIMSDGTFDELQRAVDRLPNDEAK